MASSTLASAWAGAPCREVHRCQLRQLAAEQSSLQEAHCRSLKTSLCPARDFRHMQAARTRCGRPAHRRLAHRCVAEKSPWAILGVQPGSGEKELKKAFKAKARKLHPDVNKAADASERFMECRQAYITLTDSRLRAEYDRRTQGGSAGFSWDVGSPWDTTKVRQATEDAFYGFTEFFRDLDADLKKRRERRDRKPSSLWEELADIGEDFVEFLEGATGRSSTSQGGKAEQGEQQQQQKAAQASSDARQTAQEAAAKAEADAERSRLQAENERSSRCWRT